MTAFAPFPIASEARSSDQETDFQQLRHQTKNALAAILMHTSKRLRAAGCWDVATEVERRILLTAEISNALFGLTHAPISLEERLRSLCRGIVDLLSDPTQDIVVEVDVHSGVPLWLDATILRAAHELVGNAVKHGMIARSTGQIRVVVTADADGTVLVVADNGWGFAEPFTPGDGLQVAVALAKPFGGKVTLRRGGDFTVATLQVP
ncbi:MAG: ATP-binding protein [Janthinobacterium lividum]